MSDEKKAVREFMISISLGLLIYIPLICVIYAIIGRFSLGVPLGAVYGSAVMLLFYYLFARAVIKASTGDPDAAKKRIQASYSMRMFMIVVLIGAGIFFSTDSAPIRIFEWLPIVVSMIIPRIAMAVWQIVNKKRQGDSGTKESDGTNAD